MSRRIRFSQLFLVGIIASMSPALGYAQDTTFCAIDDVPATATASPFSGVTEVPVFAHVITKQDGTTGYVAPNVLQAQIDVLNIEFAIFNFTLIGYTYTKNDNWFENVQTPDADPERVAMQSALAVDPARVMNMYTVNLDNDGPFVMGFSHIPGEDPENSTLNGFVMDYRTLPGMGGKGGLTSDHGDWAVHEAGHYFGLHHTYYDPGVPGNCPIIEADCSREGDFICDTEPHYKPDFAEVESCNQATGLCQEAPNKNHMNSLSDHCRREFTNDQDDRMKTQTAEHKPTLVAAAGDEVHFDSGYTVGSATDMTFVGSVDYYLADNLTIESGATLTIEEGVSLFFSPGKQLVVSGDLVAAGTGAASVVFDGNPTWTGIYFGSGSTGNLDHVVVDGVQRYGGSAIQLADADVWIDYSTVRNCSGACSGIYAANNSYLWIFHSTIDDNSTYGVYVSGSSGYFIQNNIENNATAGVLASYYASPLFGYPSTPYFEGRNTLTGGNYGVRATNNGSPDVGLSTSLAYNNRLYSNSSFDASASSNSDIIAKDVWWGQSNCPPTTIQGNVTWNPCEPNDPGAAFKAQGEDPPVVTSPIHEILIRAIEYRHLRQFDLAFQLVKQIIVTAPQSMEVRRAVSELGLLYGETRNAEALSLLESQAQDGMAFQLVAVEVLMNAHFRLGNDAAGRAIAEQLVRDHPGTVHEMNALLSLFYSSAKNRSLTEAGDALATLSSRFGDNEEVLAATWAAELEGVDANEQGKTADDNLEAEPTGVGSAMVNPYPNPFHARTVFEYRLDRSARVRLAVVDLLGRTVRELIDAEQGAGSQRVMFDAANLATGVYIWKLEIGDRAETGSLVLMK